MSKLQANNNYYDTISPTGRNIQGITPVKKYYILENPYEKEFNETILNIPIEIRDNIKTVNQVFNIKIKKNKNGTLQPYIINMSDYNLAYSCTGVQFYNNITSALKFYQQRDSEYTTLKPSIENTLSFITLSSMGQSVDTNSLGNDIAKFNLNININNRNFNLLCEWFMPLNTDIKANGYFNIEIIDNYINLV